MHLYKFQVNSTICVLSQCCEVRLLGSLTNDWHIHKATRWQCVTVLVSHNSATIFHFLCTADMHLVGLKQELHKHTHPLAVRCVDVVV